MFAVVPVNAEEDSAVLSDELIENYTALFIVWASANKGINFTSSYSNLKRYIGEELEVYVYNFSVSVNDLINYLDNMSSTFNSRGELIFDENVLKVCDFLYNRLEKSVKQTLQENSNYSFSQIDSSIEYPWQYLDYLDYSFHFKPQDNISLGGNNLEGRFNEYAIYPVSGQYVNGEAQVYGLGTNYCPSVGTCNITKDTDKNFFESMIFYGDLADYPQFVIRSRIVSSYSRFYLFLFDKNDSSKVSNYNNALASVSGVNGVVESSFDLTNSDGFADYMYNLRTYNSVNSSLNLNTILSDDYEDYYFIIYIGQQQLNIPVEFQGTNSGFFYRNFTGTRHDGVVVSNYSNIPLYGTFTPNLRGELYFNDSLAFDYSVSVFTISFTTGTFSSLISQRDYYYQYIENVDSYATFSDFISSVSSDLTEDYSAKYIGKYTGNELDLTDSDAIALESQLALEDAVNGKSDITYDKPGIEKIGEDFGKLDSFFDEFFSPVSEYIENITSFRDKLSNPLLQFSRGFSLDFNNFMEANSSWTWLIYFAIALIILRVLIS